MSSEKPNFLSQPVVKNIYVFRNGDPYYEARRIVINQKRVSNFETLLREVTGGIQPPFGAVRTIYTPRGGHKVDSLENLKSGEQYVAAGREKFKRMDYQKIGSRRRRMLHTHPAQAKPLLQNRIIVSARFLKPIKEPCTIFVVANGDVLNPAMRLLIHQRMLSQFDRILELITEKMGLRVLGGVRSLYTYEGTQMHDGNQLESGQLYVAVGRERFKKLPYNDLLFTKARGTRRVNGMKAYSLPPIYRFSKQNGNSKSVVNSSDSTDTRDSKASPPRHDSSKKEHLSAIVREISQARLISLRKKRSRQSMTLSVSDNADLESKADERSTQDKAPQDLPGEEEPTEDDTKAEESTENTVEKEGEEAPVTAENNTEEDAPDSKKESEENQEISDEEEEGEEKKENDEQHDGEEGDVTVGAEQNEEEGVEEEDVKREEQESSSNSSDKTQNDKEEENGSNSSSMLEKDEQEENIVEEKQDKDSREAEESSEELVTGVGDGERQEEEDSGDGHEKTLSDMETKENHSNSDQEDVSAREDGTTKESGEAETTANGVVSDVEEGENSDTEQGVQEKNAARARANTEKVADDEQETKVSE